MTYNSEQGRLDGAVCDFTNTEKMDFINKAHNDFGVLNIEMEMLCIAAFCIRVDIKCEYL